MESFWNGGWMLVPVAIALLYVFGVPQLVLSMRHRADLELDPIDDDVTLPEIMEDYLAKVSDGMSQIGFERCETWFIPQGDDEVTAIVRLFVNEREQDLAMANTMYLAIAGDWRVQTQYIEFSTSYENGTDVDTGNDGTLGAFPTPPHKTVTMAPWFDEPSELYEAHRKICRMVAGQTRKQWLLHSAFHGDAVALLAADCRQGYEDAEEAGYLSYCPQNTVSEGDVDAETKPGRELKNTLKGTYLMAWNMMWPFKQIITPLQLRRCRRRLEQAGVEVE